MGDCYCHVWEVDEEKIEDESLENPIFSIDVHASFTYSNRQEDDEEQEEELEFGSYIDSFESVTLQRTHQFQLDQIERDPRSAIQGILDSMYVPVEGFMIDEISTCVIRMSKDDYYRNRKVLRMRVNVDVTVAELPFHVDDENPKLIPASKAAIEGLEEFEVENPIDCAICLDGFSTGSKAKRMPCTHLFHGHCIVNWLGTSKFCPICRFELPS